MVTYIGGRADSPRRMVGTRVRLAVLGGLLAAQSGTFVWALGRPETLPRAANGGVVVLAVLSASLFALEVRRFRGATDSWWRPDWRQWIVLGVFPVLNAGLFVAYLLRRRNAVRADQPSGYWKRPVMAGVVAVVVGKYTLNVAFQLEDLSVGGALLVVSVMMAVGFTFLSVYYDIQYVSLALSNAGRDWFLDGYHWLAPLGFPIPGQVVFLPLYLFRRGTLLGRVAGSGADIEHLATGVGPPESTATGDNASVPESGDAGDA